MKIQIQTGDGFVLRGDIYFAGIAPISELIIVNSALGFPRQFYEPFAKYLAAQGYAAITYDYRGIGESQPYVHKSFKKACEVWGSQDFSGVVIFIQSMFPKYEIHVIGHGLGGCIVGYSTELRSVKTILTIASQDSWFKEWPPARRFQTFFNWMVVAPLSIAIKGRFDSWQHTDYERIDDEEVRMLSLDPRPSFFEKAGSKYFELFTGKLLSISISDDPMLSNKGIARVHDKYKNATRLIREVFPEDLEVARIGFSGFFQERFKESLWSITVQWLSDFDQLGDHVYAKFDESNYPIVKIEFRMAEPTIEEGLAYFDTLLSYFKNGEVYYLMDIRRVHWQDMRMMKLARQRVNENAKLIRSRHRGTAYVVKSGFLRNMIRLFHVIETAKIIRPVKVFATIPEAMSWLRDLHSGKNLK
jgi:predicted alpha/beta hydrolase